MVVVSPRAHATTGPKGLAIAHPISEVVVGRKQSVAIAWEPRASAVAGPGGVAHAASDLYLYEFEYGASTQYLPFYGGARGQYLEVQKDNKGFVVSEKIVAEESITSENFVKNKDDSLLSRVFAANLQSVRTLSNNVLKLLTLGRKTGSLGNTDKARFKKQLTSLGEAASNTIKLVEEVGDNVDALFKSNATVLRQYEEGYEDDLADDGVGVDATPDIDDAGEDILKEGTIAEAKPVGLAVIGESGLAASRPVGTAVALKGVALARPIGTAIAGLDPTLLGINFQINQLRRNINLAGALRQ